MADPGFPNVLSVADLGGRPPPTVQNFLDFMQFFGNFDKIVCWRPPRGLAPPPTGNPGSAPDHVNFAGVTAWMAWARQCFHRRVSFLLSTGVWQTAPLPLLSVHGGGDVADPSPGQTTPSPRPLKRMVRILLQCILVALFSVSKSVNGNIRSQKCNSHLCTNNWQFFLHSNKPTLTSPLFSLFLPKAALDPPMKRVAIF